MADYDYVVVDVFTADRFSGNPLAVITDARGLSTHQMQAIAREFNFSETSFILPPADQQNDAEVRIFIPTQEIPFAGHPNVGTAHVAAWQGELFGKRVGTSLKFEEQVGLINIDLTREEGELSGATVRAAGAFERRSEVPTADVAACLGLSEETIATTLHQPLIATVGLAFCIVELDGLNALAAATPDVGAFRKAAAANDRFVDDRLSIYCYVRTGEGRVQARMFAPLSGTFEDPATGSAAGALGGLLAELEHVEGQYNLTIAQGLELGRPSQINVTTVRHQSVVEQVTIGGKAVEVMRGKVTV